MKPNSESTGKPVDGEQVIRLLVPYSMVMIVCMYKALYHW